MAWSECPFPHGRPSAGYHLYPDLGIIEIINPKTGEVVPNGQPGEIVFTPLDACGSVALRYRTGDFTDGGITMEPCPYCHRMVPRLTGNISRSSEIREMNLDKIKGTLVDFNELEQLGREGVRGKIVLFNAVYRGYGQTVVYRSNGPSRAAALGAVAALVRTITPLAMQLPHTGSLTYDDAQPKIPAAAVSLEDAMMLSRFYAAKIPIRVTLTMGAHMEPDADSFDVMGEIPGREHPEEVVVLGGHLDSWDVGRGAQDDGSGIIASLQAVAIIKKLGLRPRRTIRVVFWVNEENGARGGQAYRAWIGNALANHVAAIEMDGGAERPLGFGYGAGGGRAVIGLPPTSAGQFAADQSAAEKGSVATLRQIGKLLERIGASEITPGGGGSDIGPITREGVPSLAPRTTGEHYFDWHHSEADTLDKVDLEDFRKNIAALAVMSYALADMPGRIAGERQSN